jgi:hypothetical protein
MLAAQGLRYFLMGRIVPKWRAVVVSVLFFYLGYSSLVEGWMPRSTRWSQSTVNNRERPSPWIVFWDRMKKEKPAYLKKRYDKNS